MWVAKCRSPRIGYTVPVINRKEVKRALIDCAPIMWGLAPLGIAFGLLLRQAGFAWYWAPIFSTLIYAGSMEFLAISLITGGTSLVGAALVGFLVNFRHIFYGLTYPITAVKNWAARAYSMYSITDETYAIVSARQAREAAEANQAAGAAAGTAKGDEDAPGSAAESAPAAPGFTGDYVVTIHVFCQFMWMFFGILGAVAGAALPDDIKGMEFALTALFVVLAMESFHATRDFSLPLIAVVLAVLATIFVGGSVMAAALSTYFAMMVLRFYVPKVDRALTWRLGAQHIVSVVKEERHDI